MLLVEKKHNRFDEENKNIFNFNNILLFWNKAFLFLWTFKLLFIERFVHQKSLLIIQIISQEGCIILILKGCGF